MTRAKTLQSSTICNGQNYKMEVINMTELLERFNKINKELNETNDKTILRNVQLEHEISMKQMQEINSNLKNLGGIQQ